jgi:hypothetical protein
MLEIVKRWIASSFKHGREKQNPFMPLLAKGFLRSKPQRL